MHELDYAQTDVLQVAAHLDQLALAEYRLAVQELVVQNRQQKQVVQAAEGAQRRHYFVQVLLAELGQVSLKSNGSQPGLKEN